jgi:hypothetical protein
MEKESSNFLVDYQLKEVYVQTWWSSFITSLNYITSDIIKKKRSFLIGVFSIYLVVSFITFLKSVIDISPIVFLNVGQEQAGIFDFEIYAS